MPQLQSPRILLVDDDAGLASMLGEILQLHGFEVADATSGEAALGQVASNPRDLVVLDVMLPGISGFEVLARMRRTSDVPVIMLTARGAEAERIAGLTGGADDYLAKPFNPRELVARVRAILRRTRDAHRPVPAVGERFRFAGFSLDTATRLLSAPHGAPIELTGGEYDLLLTLLRHAQRVLSRDQLLDWTRGRSAMPFDRSIDVQIGRLRRKLEAHPGGAALIKTVRGGGYVLAAEVDRA